MTKKIGGIVMRQVVAELCPVCGKTREQCRTDWRIKLGITGDTADTSGGNKSEYYKNLQKIRQAIVSGDDPFCFRASLAAYGYVPHWTPYMPPGTLVPGVKQPHAQGPTQEVDIGTTSDSRSGTGFLSGGGDATAGSGRRKRGKSVRRKR